MPKPTTATKPQPAANTTTVVGYFNNNNYPVQIECNELNVRFTLAQKGEYILDREGNKVNDPAFLRYCRVGFLSKEETVGGARVPIRYLRRPEAASGATGFSGHTGGEQPRPRTNTPAASTNPIQGYASVAEALKAGVFGGHKATPIPDEFGVPADQLSTATPQTLPTISDAVKKPAQQTRPAARVATPPPLPAAGYDPLDISGPAPSLEESDSTPVDVLETTKVTPPPIPARLLPIIPEAQPEVESEGDGEYADGDEGDEGEGEVDHTSPAPKRRARRRRGHVPPTPKV